MKILSLFDGMACGYEALQRAGIKVDAYYASEIDKYAIQIATKNHPDIIEIGDVTQVKGEDYQDVDLLIGGSPCQGFSVAGKMLNFNDHRSKLFFEFVRLKNEIKPKYFLLENVKMKKEWQDIISEYLGVQPIEINSALVSAQNRRRLYRTNIPGVIQPKDKGIILKDILQDHVDEKYYLSNEQLQKLNSRGIGRNDRGIEHINTKEDEKIGAITSHCGNMCNTIKLIQVGYIGKNGQANRVYSTEGKSVTLKGEAGGMGAKMGLYMINVPQIVKVRKHEVDTEGLKQLLRNNKNKSCKQIAEELGVPQTKVEHWFRTDNSFAIPDAEIWYKLKDVLGIATDKFDKSITEFEERPGVYEKAERKISVEGKMTTLTTSGNDEIINGARIRKLTPIECERLQTLPDNYTEGVSDSQRYKMLGNGWTVDVISHIFSFIK